MRRFRHNDYVLITHLDLIGFVVDNEDERETVFVIWTDDDNENWNSYFKHWQLELVSFKTTEEYRANKVAKGKLSEWLS